MHGDPIPHDGRLFAGDTLVFQEAGGRFGALDLERHRAHETLGEPEIVEHAGEKEKLFVPTPRFASPDQRAEEIGAHAVVEKVGRTRLARQSRSLLRYVRVDQPDARDFGG